MPIGTSTSAGASFCAIRQTTLVNWPYSYNSQIPAWRSGIVDSTGRTPAPDDNPGEPPNENTLDSSNRSSESMIPSELPAIEDEPTQLLEPETQLLPTYQPPEDDHAEPVRVPVVSSMASIGDESREPDVPDEIENVEDIPTQVNTFDEPDATTYRGQDGLVEDDY